MRTRIILMALVAVLLMSGCRSSRHAARTVDTQTGATEQTWTTPQEFNTPADVNKEEKSKKKKNKKDRQEETTVVTRTQAKAVTAKLNLALNAGSKKVNLGGTYRLKRDEVIQMNLTYTMLFTLNVGTLELTPDYLLFVDRMNKRYCRVAYSDVPMLARAGIDFAYLQRIFWGEETAAPSADITWSYANWTELSGGQFPGQIQFTAKTGNETYRATFGLTNLRESADWETRTEVGDRYTAISLDSILRALMSAVQ